MPDFLCTNISVSCCAKDGVLCKAVKDKDATLDLPVKKTLKRKGHKKVKEDSINTVLYQSK